MINNIRDTTINVSCYYHIYKFTNKLNELL